MEKFISSVDELDLGRCINGGSCSRIYEFGTDLYFKEFEDDYRDLSDPINTEFYEVITHLSNIDGMPYIVRARDIYRSSSELFGYSMPVVRARQLHSISDDVLVDDVFNGFKLLSDDIRVLSDNYVKTEDVGGDNILFNGFMYLIDLDLSLVDRRYVPDELYEKTINSVLSGLNSRLLGKQRMDDVVDVGKLDEYFSRLREISSTSLGHDVKTIGEMKSGYQKVYKKCK